MYIRTCILYTSAKLSNERVVVSYGRREKSPQFSAVFSPEARRTPPSEASYPLAHHQLFLILFQPPLNVASAACPPDHYPLHRRCRTLGTCTWACTCV